ncbi:MAG: hypothetical protein CMH54_10625 [Myxococcales bacterium]|nr:hypothetical protein [Myxococcales bacterium]
MMVAMDSGIQRQSWWLLGVVLLFALSCAADPTGNADNCVGKCDDPYQESDVPFLGDDVNTPDPGEWDCQGTLLSYHPNAMGEGDCALIPGIGIENLVLLGSNYAQVKATLGSPGEATSIEQNRSYMGDMLQLTYGDLNLNGTVDDEDPVIAIAVSGHFGGTTDTGIGLGIGREDLDALYTPDATIDLPELPPFHDGIGHISYTGGLSVLVDGDDVATGIILHRAYNVAADGSFDPFEGTVELASTAIRCGDGREGGESGSSPYVYESILDAPDFRGQMTVEVSIADVDLSLDMYSMLGINFVRVVEIRKGFLGTETPNELAMVILSPPYSGQTAEGIRIGSKKWLVESALDLDFEKTDELIGFTIHIYMTSSGKRLGVVYTNDGISTDDEAILFLLNMTKEL